MFANDKKVYHPIPAEWDPVVYSSKIEDTAHDNCVLTQLCNREYEGELKGFGSKLVIRTMPELKVRDWAPGTPYIPQRPTSPALEVTVGRAYEGSFVIDDWDMMNSDIKGWEQKWAAKIAIAADEKQEQEFFSEFPAFAHPDNQGDNAGASTHTFHLGTLAAPILLTHDGRGYTPGEGGALPTMDATNLFLDAEVVHAEQEGASAATGKFTVVPHAILNIIRKNEIWAKAAYSGDSQSILRKSVLAAGSLGVGGFTVYATNHLKPVTEVSGHKVYAIPFGDTRAVTYADLFSRVDIKDEPHTVGVKYQVITGGYDWWCVHPEYFGVMYVAL